MRHGAFPRTPHPRGNDIRAPPERNTSMTQIHRPATAGSDHRTGDRPFTIRRQVAERASKTIPDKFPVIQTKLDELENRERK